MTKFREESPADFAGVKVVSTEDYKLQRKTNADGTSTAIDMPVSDVLKYLLADGTWIAIRPSGTEPKVKFYVGTVADSKDAADKKLADFETALTNFKNS